MKKASPSTYDRVPSSTPLECDVFYFLHLKAPNLDLQDSVFSVNQTGAKMLAAV